MGLVEAGSVQEALAGLLPPAGCAPLVPVLNAIHLTALLGLSTGFPDREQNEGVSLNGADPQVMAYHEHANT